MERVTVKILKLVDSATLPTYAHEDDSGMDLCAIATTDIEPGKTALIRTGIAIEIPMGTEAQVRPRSGLALKHAITVLNTPGTVDASYRGEIGVVLINHGQKSFRVEPGMKIAQMVIAPILRADLQEVDQLSDTDRGKGGYGSTGV